MTNENISSHMEAPKSEMAMQQRPVMPAEIFNAAIKGNTDLLIQRLGLLEEHKEFKITIGASHDSAPRQTEEEEKTVQLELRSATRFGDTLLHLLINERHNELALKVFSKDMSLLKARNNKQETPLHCAAKLGNEEVIRDLIRLHPGVVRDALGEANENGDTALHVAAKHNHGGVVVGFMKSESEIASTLENKNGFTPLYIAIVEGYTSLVKEMLEVDDTLACTQFSDGLFPVLVAAGMGNTNLVVHFLQKYPDSATLLNPCRRNLFHMAAEQENEEVYTKVCELTKNGSTQMCQMVESMINAPDCEGNTPLHIAAMKGHKSIMRFIWERLNCDQREVANEKGETAFGLSVIQVKNANKGLGWRIDRYVRKNGPHLTQKWFNHIMRPTFPNELERTQAIGLGSVLIATVTFNAAIDPPGGINEVEGSPLLANAYWFNAFMIANTLAFGQAFLSVFILVMKALQSDADPSGLHLATTLFVSAAYCMVLAFGTASFVMLFHVSNGIAVIVFSIAIIFSLPTVIYVIWKHNIISTWYPNIGFGWGLAFSGAIILLPFLCVFGIPATVQSVLHPMH
ncbi:Ankyrin repeat protein-like [Rhynchospora pubera]|uniref:Ankyrin repeat protein-like n=1 Tax=Rhynchospora pubera TaxID=906938 RepID=A0AAV8FLA0_9POAL|nr:Ankyrin repeat protein-like [Rhynchospora pubera]